MLLNKKPKYFCQIKAIKGFSDGLSLEKAMKQGEMSIPILNHMP